MHRLVLGISGASGMPLAQAVLENLATVSDLEVHLIISAGAERVLQAECGIPSAALARYAHAVHESSDMAAGPSSGSWHHDGMIICPGSMSSLASIASGAGSNLIHRAADVTLKERRPLVIVARETPLNLIHLKNMQAVTEAGAVVMPFTPAFYTRDTSFEAMMRHFTGRLLD
ncbi:MAG: UbiX family flavin prenyltransferase, partial [Bilophila wadsworthia]